MITLANGRVFMAPGDVTILDAARQQGLVLEHSCRTGRCGVCRATVLSGTTTLKQPEQSVVPTLAANQILTCCRAADGDVTLDVEDIGRLVGISVQTLPCRITTIDRCAVDIVHVTLRLPPTARFDYLPGQYIDVIVAGDRRSYSIANAPREDRLIELYIRHYPGGRLSEYWFERAQPGDLLRFEGPFGTFFRRDQAVGTVVFLATGTGIAPVKALLEEIAATPSARPHAIKLFWGNRDPGSFCWTPASLGFDLDHTPVLSGAAPWAGARGWVQHAALSSPFDPDDTIVYACGSEQMIASARAAFVARGLPERRFLADAFVVSN